MQPALAAAAGQFQRKFARPPPDANVEELKVQAHKSAFSYPDAVYLLATTPSLALLQGLCAWAWPSACRTACVQQFIRTPVCGLCMACVKFQHLQAAAQYTYRRGTAYQALMRGSVAVSTSSWDMMEAMPSPSAL